jgi:hypothetical protein
MMLFQSARGLAQSRTLRAIGKSQANASRHGLRRPSAAFPTCQASIAPLLRRHDDVILFAFADQEVFAKKQIVRHDCARGAGFTNGDAFMI